MKFLETLDLPFARKYRQAIFMHPRWTPNSTFHDYVPFAFFLSAILKPKKYVELGVFLGTSFFSFCQSSLEFQYPCKCYGIDTWKGDAFTGFYEEDIYKTIVAVHDVYKDFSSLMRMKFNTASNLPELNNIDLLHIDGIPTYKEVKNNFEKWLPKMSDKGVMVFHNTNNMNKGFEVSRFWAEISREYPSSQFYFGKGLGVLLVGYHKNEELLEFISDKDFDGYQQLFQAVGGSI